MGLIITERYLKDNGVINDNADMKIITPIIELCQDKYIHPILGTDLYTEIQTQIDSVPQTISAANEALLDLVLKCLVWYSQMESIPFFKYRFMNKGIMVKNSDNSSAADLDEIKWMMDAHKNNAEWYAERVTKFLKANTTTYPLYCANTDCDDIQPNKTNYTCSIYLGDSDLTEEELRKIKIGNY